MRAEAFGFRRECPRVATRVVVALGLLGREKGPESDVNGPARIRTGDQAIMSRLL